MISRVVPHAVESGCRPLLAHTETVQNGHTGRHQSFAAWFLSGEMAALEELHLQATSSKQNLQEWNLQRRPRKLEVSHSPVRDWSCLARPLLSTPAGRTFEGPSTFSEKGRT